MSSGSSVRAVSEGDVALSALVVGFVMVIALMVNAVFLGVRPISSQPAEIRSRYEAPYVRIAVIEPGGFFHIVMDIPRGMQNAMVEGDFVVYGLLDCVEVFIFDRWAFLRWKEGRSFTAHYASGMARLGSISVSLRPGDYVLVFSNAFCCARKKTVWMELKVTWPCPRKSTQALSRVRRSADSGAWLEWGDRGDVFGGFDPWSSVRPDLSGDLTA